MFGKKVTGSACPNLRKPPPEGVVEVVGKLGRNCSLVELEDGSLMAVGGNSYMTSKDDGVTWSDHEVLALPGAGGREKLSITRLKSGKLAVYSKAPRENVEGGGARGASDKMRDYHVFRYMNVCFVKGKVFILYAREWLEVPEDLRVFEDAYPSRKKGHEQVLRIYPLEYFYQ